MTNAFDMSKIHVNMLDTGSYYFSVSGNRNEPNTQGFKHVINDIDFYRHYYKLFLPSEDLLDKNAKISVQKKLLGCCVEKSYNSMICLGPKCYAGIDDKSERCKAKGINLNKNPNIKYDSYLNVLDNSTVIEGVHTGFQIKKNKIK